MAETKKTARTPAKAKTTTKKNDKTATRKKATSKTAKKSTRGRPKAQINKDTFEELCNIQCTLEEIAGCFKVSVDTIERWCKREYGTIFAEVYKMYSAGGKASLRRTQFKLAESSSSMAIWLGKQYLGQKDNAYEDMSGDTNDVEIYMPKKDGEP